MAQQYAEEWENRLKILHDDSVKTVEFMWLQYYPESLLSIELQVDENGIAKWINDSCAIYYDKESVCIIDYAPED